MNRRAGLKPLVAHVAVAAACLAALPDGQGRLDIRAVTPVHANAQPGRERAGASRESLGHIGDGPIVFGRTGALDEDDAMGAGKHQDRFEFTASARVRITVELESGTFDTYLILEGPDRFLEVDDDGGNGTDSRIETELPATGVYTVIVTSYGDGTTGDYRLAIASRDDESTSLAGRAWRVSDAYPSGVVAVYDVVFGDRGRLTSLEMVADPTEGDDRWEQLADTVTLSFNDGYASYEGKLSQDGDSISGSATNQQGLEWSWSAQAVELPDPSDAATGSLRDLGNEPFGEVGALSANDTIVDGKYRDRFEFTARARARVTIELESGTFDTYLILEGPDRFREVDDDGGDGRDSRIETELPVTRCLHGDRDVVRRRRNRAL